jgi:hypothetical protein
MTMTLERPTAPLYLPEGYRERTRTWKVPGPARNYQVEHWDDRLDAIVCPDPIRVSLKGSALEPIVTGQGMLFNPAIAFARRGFVKSRLHQLRRADDGAITTSGLLIPTLLDIFDTTQLAIDLDLETHRGALFNDTIVPNFDTDTAYGVAPYNANEVTGTNWAAGGVVLTGTVFTNAAAGWAVFDATDVSVATVTISSAMGYLLYADVLAGDRGIVLVDFVTAVNCSGGTFQILWTAPGSGGVFYFDGVPG